MHECFYCTLTIGELYKLVVTEGDFAICSICNGDISGQYPRKAIYQGITLRRGIYRHEFYDKTKLPCQSCGSNTSVSCYDCQNDGGVLMLELEGSQANEEA